MMHKSFRRTLTTQERRLVRNWTWGVLTVYGGLALTLLGLVSLSQHLANASKEPTLTAVTAATADRNQRNR